MTPDQAEAVFAAEDFNPKTDDYRRIRDPVRKARVRQAQHALAAAKPAPRKPTTSK
jgi:hypothetical protein